MTNILRHANAERVSIELYETGGEMILAVEDDGNGFSPEQQPEGARHGRACASAPPWSTGLSDSTARREWAPSVKVAIPLDEVDR